MAQDLFEFIENLFIKKTIVTSKNDFREQYMAVKFLSLSPVTFIVADEANRLMAKIPPWATNMYLFVNAPHRRPPKMAYPKKGDPTEKTYPKEVLEKVANKYCCTIDNATQILKILNKQDPTLLEAFGVELTEEKADKENDGKNKNRRLPKQRGKAR
jgi:hypothetical protein